MTALPDNLKLLAAEYALGTLEGADRERAEALEISADDFRVTGGADICWRSTIQRCPINPAESFGSAFMTGLAPDPPLA
jgi:hypothetical protein